VRNWERLAGTLAPPMNRTSCPHPVNLVNPVKTLRSPLCSLRPFAAKSPGSASCSRPLGFPSFASVKRVAPGRFPICKSCQSGRLPCARCGQISPPADRVGCVGTPGGGTRPTVGTPGGGASARASGLHWVQGVCTRPIACPRIPLAQRRGFLLALWQWQRSCWWMTS
jgi:hypothetical protein